MTGLVVIGALSVSNGAMSQSFTQHLQKQGQGEGNVTIHQDKAIDALVNGGAAPKASQAGSAKKDTKATKKETPAAKKETTATKKETTAAKKETTAAKKETTATKKETTAVKKEAPAPQKDETPVKKESHDSTHQQPVDSPATVTSTIPDTTAVKRRTYRTTGYRVQVYAGGNSRRDRQKAEQIGNQMRTLFPDEQVYVHFYSPRWLCRVGNYKTYQEANLKKHELKELGFSTATIVKGKITLTY